MLDDETTTKKRIVLEDLKRLFAPDGGYRNHTIENSDKNIAAFDRETEELHSKIFGWNHQISSARERLKIINQNRESAIHCKMLLKRIAELEAEIAQSSPDEEKS